MKHYPDADQNPDFPKIEQNILDFWQREGVFAASIDQRHDEKEFIFYDGPPFANGLPHYGHLLTGFVKDAFARYQTMRGRRVERRFGWDCHGLPAEMGSEKELGISGRAAITEFGIGKFNEHCRTSVMKYTSEWEYYVNRQARWVDFKNDYKTMDTNFMESVLWAFKQLWDKGLVYEAYRVMPYSWAAETPLSNFETKLDNSYREREDKAITVAFELNEPPKGAPKADKYYVLAWTTTPWTLPSNLALAASKEIEYSAWLDGDTCYIASTSATIGNKLAGSIKLPEAHQRQEDGTIPITAYMFNGAGLIGLTYKPLFPYFADRATPVIPTERSDEGSHLKGDSSPSVRNDKAGAFRILDGSNFVTDGDGTGIVHMAPGFGEDDQKCCEANGIEIVVPVDGQGKYTDAIFDLPDLSLKGLNVIEQIEGKREDEPFKDDQIKKFGLVNLRIVKWLKERGQLIKDEQFKHNYPHCWRTDKPLIYRAMPSWYVEVTKFRDRAVELNKQINWIPEHIRDGQMAHMLATAPDWSISRNRFWGTPIPVWRAKSGKVIVIGSIAELEQLSGKKVPDLHRPIIDEITIEKDGETYTRVEDVFDCWFESGSMPFAQVHYPFENKEWFETHFPADFITEYVGQTRGWFNTLIMLSTALFDKPPFKNCICHGVVLDAETGLKYSKRLKNYKDPKEVMDVYGADALRWLMLASPVMRGHDLAVDPEGKFIRDVVRLAIKPIWNAYNFFTLYANADGVKAYLQVGPDKLCLSREYESNSIITMEDFKNTKSPYSHNEMDRYLLAKCRLAVEAIQKSLDAYDTPTACEVVLDFFTVLNNRYIRRNKERFWSEEKTDDKQAAYDTLYTVLVTMCKAAAPLLPLTLEEIYQKLTHQTSVHLEKFPEVSNWSINEHLISGIDAAFDICNAALAIRNANNIRVRLPLSTLKVVTSNQEISGGVLAFGELITDEVNVKSIASDFEITNYATLKLSINSQVLGKRLPALMKQILPASKKGEWKQVGGTVEICGEKLLPSEYTLQLEPKPEYAARAQALSSNDALVILDTTITPELEAEGIARDLVRMVQQARKDAGLHVSDRISLAIVAGEKTAAAAGKHSAYICEQTLAMIINRDDMADAYFSASGEIEGETVKIFLKHAA